MVKTGKLGKSCRALSFCLMGMGILSACATANVNAPANGTVQKAVASAPKAPIFYQRDVLDRTPAALDKTFGEPALTRREGVGEFRRYTLAACNLIVILYPNDKNTMRSIHADATAKHSDDPAPDLDQCLAAGLPTDSVGA